MASEGMAGDGGLGEGMMPSELPPVEQSGLRVQARRAIEALRAGVPNHDAVLALGGGQPQIEARFRQKLEEADDDVERSTQTSGLIVAGDFGSGKSHLLVALEQLALRENFVCSTVSVSKEIPLHDPDKLYRAAIRSARLPDRRGNALAELAFKLNFDSLPYEELVEWSSSSASHIATRFPASLLVFQRTHDEETKDRIISFWGGDPLNTSQLRRWLRDQGEAGTFPLEHVPQRELPLQHFQFTSRLISAAGYAGWVLLVDELELIAQYSAKARAQAYHALARWSGRLKDLQCPGLLTVFTITRDFTTLVLHQRNDVERIPDRLRSSPREADRVLSVGAELGMRAIERDRIALTPPDAEALDRLQEQLQEIHGAAYDWRPPTLPPGERATSTSMRQYVRRWINEWDLLRLDPEYRPSTVAGELVFDYDEDADLEQPPEHLEQPPEDDA
ncbi:MAG: DUF2791 family P-loop domain-containing protein [Chloroflexi bacterium]|nr:DUF2791 family P-loop domain-containing protein [Chloroflexota bacterium]